MQIRTLHAYHIDDNHSIALIAIDSNRKVHKAVIPIPFEVDDLPTRLYWAGVELAASIQGVLENDISLQSPHLPTP